jgi:hypothetical protein
MLQVVMNGVSRTGILIMVVHRDHESQASLPA